MRCSNCNKTAVEHKELPVKFFPEDFDYCREHICVTDEGLFVHHYDDKDYIESWN